MINIRSQKAKKKEKRFKSFNDFQLPIIQEKLSSVRLGPGSYNLSLNTFNGPCYHFSQAMRFEFDDPYQKYIRSFNKNPSSGVSSEVNIEAFRRDYKISKIKKNALELERKLSEIQTNKKKILQNKKLKFLTSLKEKTVKYEFRQKMKESRSICKISQVLLVIISASTRLAKEKKKLVLVRYRSNRLARIFTKICLMLGKLKMISRRMKEFRSYKVIKRAAQQMKYWLRKRRNNHTRKIGNICFGYLQAPGLFIALAKLKETVRGIQRAWRRCLLSKKVALKAKILIYREIEKLVLAKNKNKSFVTAQKRTLKREIRIIRLKRLKKYLNELEKYKKDCKEIDIKNNKKKGKFGNFSINGEVRIDGYPEKPVAYYSINKDKYIQMIHYLTSKRSHTNIKLDKITSLKQLKL